jgi:uncharacterized protein YpmS
MRMNHDPGRRARLSRGQWILLVLLALGLALSVTAALLELSWSSTSDQDLCVGLDTTSVSCPSDAPSP